MSGINSGGTRGQQGVAGPIGAQGPGTPRARLTSTLVLGAVSEQSFFTKPGNQGTFTWSVVAISPEAAVTANDTNFASVVLKHYDSTGALLDTVTVPFTVTGTNHTGNMPQNGSVTITLGASIAVAAGDTCSAQITKTGTGLITPALSIILG